MSKKSKKVYQCSLDEIQCKETCHENFKLKEKCPYRKVKWYNKTNP